MVTSQLMELGHGDATSGNSLKGLEAMQKISPFAPLSTSYGMGWKGLQAVRIENPVSALRADRSRTHVLVLTIRPPEKADLQYEGFSARLRNQFN
jgi:hypothetical protein